jgi:hypothetical protein
MLGAICSVFTITTMTTPQPGEAKNAKPRCYREHGSKISAELYYNRDSIPAHDENTYTKNLRSTRP